MIQRRVYKRASEEARADQSVSAKREEITMMYLQVALLVACAALTSAIPHNLAKRQTFSLGFPFHNSDDDSDRDIFHPFFPFQGDDERVEDPFTGFKSLFELFEAQLRRMEDEVYELHKRLDDAGIDSTSNTTVIDGHVVTINETTRRGNDTDNPFFHHVKVVVIRPSESPEDEGPVVPSNEDIPEPYDPNRGDEPTYSNNDEENEIPSNDISHEDWKMWPGKNESGTDIVSNHITSEERLSDDLDVNDRLNKIAKGVGYLPVHPEVEVLRDEDGNHVDLFPNQEKEVPVVYNVVKG